VLPAPSALAALPAAATAPWQALEHWLLSRELQLPVYFAHEDEQLANIIAQLGAELVGGSGAGSADTRYQVVAGAAEAVEVTTPSATNVYGWLHGATAVAPAADAAASATSASASADAGSAAAASAAAKAEARVRTVNNSTKKNIFAIIVHFRHTGKNFGQISAIFVFLHQNKL
jgi:hypothetical protein